MKPDVLPKAPNNLLGLSLCFSTIKQTRIINVAEKCKSWASGFTTEKKMRKTSVLGNHRICLMSHNYLQGDTEGYTEASNLPIHNRRRESLDRVIVIASNSPGIHSIDSFLTEHLFFSVRANSAWQQVGSDVSNSVSAPAAAQDHAKVPSPPPAYVWGPH